MSVSLYLKNIYKSFGKNTIYQDVSFEFRAGCYVIKGKNGLGKSVLLEMLAGVTRQDEGSIIMSDVGDSATIGYKRRLTYVPSKPIFFPNATGEDYLSFIYSVKKDEINHQKFMMAVDSFRVNDYLKTKFQNMSLGSQKKLFLATVAMSNSPLIVLDEPSNALDEQSSLFLAKMINEASNNSIVIIATHDEKLAANICPTVISLKAAPICQFEVVNRI